MRSKKTIVPITNEDEGHSGNADVAFFHYVFALYKIAQHAAGGAEYYNFKIGDFNIQLCCAGSALLDQLTPAIAHLEEYQVGKSDLKVYMWDSVSTGTPLPEIFGNYLSRLGAWWDHLGPRGEIEDLSSERIKAAYHLGPNIFSFYDSQKNIALYWVEDAAALPYYEKGSPMRTILHWRIDGDGYQFVHGGAVGNMQGGVLLAGKGGSGKSSVALACLEAGMAYASDDYCLVRTGPDPYVYSVYNTAKLVGKDDLDRFPSFAKMVENPESLKDEKALLFVKKHLPKHVAKGFPIKAIIIPQIVGGDGARIKSVPKAVALAALAPSTLFQLPGAGAGAFKTLSVLVQNLPTYLLEIGEDIHQVPPVISKLLSEFDE